MSEKLNDYKSFEDNLKELEDIVKLLEGGKLSLDEALKKYKIGVELAQGCKSALDNAKLEIETIGADL